MSLNSLDDNDNSNTKKSFTKALKKIEDEIILKFNTLYPYGLNDRLEKPLYIDSELEYLKGVCIYKIFPARISTRSSRTSNRYHNRSDNLFEVNKTLTDIIDLYNNGNLHDCRTLICTLKYTNIIELGGLAKLNMSKASLTEKRCLVIVI